MNIKFAGINGTVTKKSPHGNYLVIKLSERIYICGTYTNIWGWAEVSDAAPFLSFITYIGSNNKDELMKVMGRVYSLGGTVDEMSIRSAKRVQDYKFEIKCRDLTAVDVRQLVKELR